VWRAEATACLLIGADRVEYQAPGRPELLSQPILGSDLSAVRSALDALGVPSATEASTGSVRVWASGRWAGMLALPWSADLARSESSVSYARGQARAAGFSLEPDDVVRIDDAPYRALRTAVIFPAALLAVLKDFARAKGLVLGPVLPLAVAAPLLLKGQRSLGAEALTLVEGGRVELLLGQTGFWTPLALLAPLEGAVELPDELARLWRRMQLRDASLAGLEPQLLDLRSSDRMQRLAGLVRLDGHPLSATVARRAPDGIRVVAACVGVAIAAYSVFQTVSVTAQWQEKRAVQLAQVVKPAASRKPTRTGEDQSRIAAVNSAILELNLPVAALLQATVAPRDVRVGLLGVEVVPGKLMADQVVSEAVFKLTAQAQSGADMARYVAVLADRRPFTSAYLVNHEVNENDPSRPYRFTVEATWHE